MTVIWKKAPDQVAQLAEELIAEFHEELLDAKIAVLFRSEAPTANGKETWGKAKKVSETDQTLVDFDFIIWLAEDVWDRLTPHQRRALLDHELTHRCYGDTGAAMRPHDIEEFRCIVERYGLWRPDLEAVAPAFVTAANQPLLPGIETLRRRGAVLTVEPELVGLGLG